MTSLSSTLQSPRVQRGIFWGAVLVFAAGAIAFASVKIGNKSEPKPVDRSPNAPVKDVSKVPKSVTLNPAARRVAQEFILTAVARKNLRRAYELAGPQIRQGQSLKEWLTGNIAVVPYPIDELRIAPMKIDYSYVDSAALEVALLPKKGSKQKPIIFYMDLIKKQGKWLVNSWVPRSAPEVPLAPN